MNGRGKSYGFRCGALMPIRESLVTKILGSGATPRIAKNTGQPDKRSMGKHRAKAAHAKWLWQQGGKTLKMIAAELDVPYDFVRKLVSGEVYPDVEPEKPQDERKAA